MTIYRHEGNRSGKRHARYAKSPLLYSSRKRHFLKSLPPIYETDEDCEEVPFLETKDINNSLKARRVGNMDCEFHAASRTFQRNATVPHAKKTLTNETRPQQQRCGESQYQDRTETCAYRKRNLGRNLSVCRVEQNNQIFFPDFFPPGMHVHCAQNALPEASKGLYMKIIQGKSELEATNNICKTNKPTNVSNNANYKAQSWMQFFG